MATENTTITVEVTVKALPEIVWELWTTPAYIMVWNNPSEGWHNTLVEVDLKDGGAFLFKMQAKDGSDGFDYKGRYDKVITNELIELTTEDGRKTINRFTRSGNETIISETFEIETNTPVDHQRGFCQQVLNSFKKYAEGKEDMERFFKKETLQ